MLYMIHAAEHSPVRVFFIVCVQKACVGCRQLCKESGRRECEKHANATELNVNSAWTGRWFELNEVWMWTGSD